MRLGPLRLLERIGAGTMGVVYRAQRDGDSTELALKLLQPGLLPLRGARVRFPREIAALRDLDHPGVCPVAQVGSFKLRLGLLVAVGKGSDVVDASGELTVQRACAGASLPVISAAGVEEAQVEVERT